MSPQAGGKKNASAFRFARRQQSAAAGGVALLLTFLTVFPSPVFAACTTGNIFYDGGFEASDPATYDNPNFTVTSTNFGTPICAEFVGPGGGCGNASGTAGPRNGTFWAWFGGIGDGGGPTAEVSSVAQTVTFPLGSTSVTLNYYLWIGRVEAPFTDTLVVQVDGVTQQTFTEPSVEEVGYTLRTLNLSAYADGAPHVIKFLYTKPAGGGTANFNVDDISIDAVCPPPPAMQFFSVTPCRVVDTRAAAGPDGGPALAFHLSRRFPFTTKCGIPTTARVVAVNVAVTQQTTGPAFLTLYPGGTTRPGTATINYKFGQTRANNAIIPLGAAGDIEVYCGQGTGTVQVIIDVNGYFQ